MSATTGSTRNEEAPGLSDATQYVGVAWEAAQRYLAAQADRLKLAVRSVVLLAAVGIVALLFVATIFICAGVLLMNGAADGLATLLGGRQWAGDLITGSTVIVGTGVIAYLAVKKITTTSRRQTMLNYKKN